MTEDYEMSMKGTWNGSKQCTSHLKKNSNRLKLLEYKCDFKGWNKSQVTKT